MATTISLVHNISFSHNLKNNTSTSSSSSSSSNYLNSSANDMDHDFDFSVSCDISTEEPSLADELFSNGMLLPLSRITNHSSKTIQPPLPLLQNVKKSESLKNRLSSQKQEIATKASFWNSISRSKSVGTTSNVNKSMFSSICPRSKSTGSCLNQNQNLSSKKKVNKKLNQNNPVNNDKYYLNYSGSSNRSNSSKGVKINPVINVPAPFIPRGGSTTGRSSKSSYDSGLITYLLCNCGFKNSMEMVKA